MGNCIARKSDNDSLRELSFQQQVSIKVTVRDQTGRPIGVDQVNFRTTRPSHRSFESINLSSSLLHISGTVLPGLDPRQTMSKQCQDLFFYSHTSQALLAVLFDGHGRQGQKVARFCTQFMQKFFSDNSEAFSEDPQAAILTMVNQCDRELRSPRSGIQARISGSTAVVVYIKQDRIIVGSVGDSRGILGSLIYPGEAYKPFQLETSNPYKRKCDPPRPLVATPLTEDQKPNHQNQLKRIQENGGTVQKLKDEFGNLVGPYRVWRKGASYPGLAMSRSIGDGLAKQLGVISTPVIQTFELYKSTDLFVVMASDGVWDVMENIEVVNFVQKFRNRNSKLISPLVYPVKVRFKQPENSTAAHLLAEEARFRWFGICEDEDVLIDDISVVVIEFTQEPGKKVERAPPGMRRSLESTQVDLQAGERRFSRKRADPKRNSMVPPDPKQDTEGEVDDDEFFTSEESKNMQWK